MVHRKDMKRLLNGLSLNATRLNSETHEIIWCKTRKSSEHGPSIISCGRDKRGKIRVYNIYIYIGQRYYECYGDKGNFRGTMSEYFPD